MSIDRSLKLKGALVRHRNVLTRAERLTRLKEEEKWEDGNSVFGLAKVANRKVSVSKKKEAKAAVEGEVAGVPGVPGAAPGAAAGKAGAPAAGKPGAPGAKAVAPAKAPAGVKAAPIKAAPAAKSSGQGKPGGGGGGRR
jgi:small basic protein (TIGR04137 family)